MVNQPTTAGKRWPGFNHGLLSNDDGAI